MRFNLTGDLDVIAPGIFQQTWSEAEALGGAVWLWMNSAAHRDAPLHTLSALLLPAIKHRQFVLASQDGRPVFFLSWADLSLEAEERYLAQPPVCMPEADWASGDRMWILDWVAPFGHSAAMRRLLERHLFPGKVIQALYHRGSTTGLKVKTFKGIAVPKEELDAWRRSHSRANHHCAT